MYITWDADEVIIKVQACLRRTAIFRRFRCLELGRCLVAWLFLRSSFRTKMPTFIQHHHQLKYGYKTTIHIRDCAFVYSGDTAGSGSSQTYVYQLRKATGTLASCPACLTTSRFVLVLRRDSNIAASQSIQPNTRVTFFGLQRPISNQIFD